MTDTFRQLNKLGLELFSQHLSEYQGQNVQLPIDLINDPQYYNDTGLSLGLSDLHNLSLWEVGKKLVPIIDNESYFETADFVQVWASLSLYFADLILPKTYKGKPRNQLEPPRYIPAQKYKHLLYSAYLCNKTWGDDSVFLLPQNFTNVQYNDFLANSALYRYKTLFKVIKTLYVDKGAKLNSDQAGSLPQFMKFARQYAMNNSLSIISEEQFMNHIPDVYKQHAEKYGK